MKAMGTVCTWCMEVTDKITKDHVFPASVGGTLHLSVPACLACQESLKVCEQEVARRSDMALVRQSSKFKVRGKTVTVALSSEQYRWLRQAVANQRELERIVRQMQTLSREVLFGSVPGVVRRKRLGKRVLGLI